MLTRLINILHKKKNYALKVFINLCLPILVLPNLNSVIEIHIYEELLKAIIYLNFCQIILGIGLNYSAPKKLETYKNHILIISNYSKIRLIFAILIGLALSFLINNNNLKILFFISLILQSQDQTWYYNFKGMYKIQLSGLLMSIFICLLIAYLTKFYLIYLCVIPLSNLIAALKLKYFLKWNIKIKFDQITLNEFYLIVSQIILGLTFTSGIVNFTNLFNQKTRVDFLLIDRVYNSLNSMGNIIFTSFIPELSNSLKRKNIFSLILYLNLPSLIVVILVLIITSIGFYNSHDFIRNNYLIIVAYSICLTFSAIGPLLTFILTNQKKEYAIFLIMSITSFVTLIIAFALFRFLGTLSWPIALCLNGFFQTWILLIELKKRKI